MKPVDIAVTVLVIALLVFAVYLNRRRKKTSSCCGNCSECGNSREDCQEKK